MIKRSTENEENNDFPPEYSTVTGLAQEQSAILIENEQLKAEMAVLTAHILQQRGKRRRSRRRENIGLGVILCVKVLIIPFSILIFIVILYYFF